MVDPVVGTKEPATTDEEGRFTLTPTVRLDTRTMRPSGEFRVPLQSLCVADEAFRRIAFEVVDFGHAPPSLEITLRPARAARIPILHEVAIPTGELSSWWELYYYGDPGKPGPGVLVGDGTVTSGGPGDGPKAGDRIEAYWPAGKYRINLHSADPKAEQGMEEAEADLIVPPGEGPVDLPPIRLTALLEQRLIGRPAPELDARDLDTGQPVRLADFRGKVVVLDFWGYWCGPCVGSMPGLVEVHRRLEGEPVVFLALHDQSIQSREAYDRKLSGVKTSLWDGRDLPFRVALDRPDPDRPADRPAGGSGVTCKRYEVQMFPTTLLIDQDGKIVGSVNARETGRLEATIRGLLEKKPSR